MLKTETFSQNFLRRADVALSLLNYLVELKK